MTRTRSVLRALCLCLAGTAVPARAGFQRVPMALPAFEHTAASPVPEGGGQGLLLTQCMHGSATRYYDYRQLVSPRTAPFALPAEDPADPIRDVAVGDLDGDGTPDLFWERPGPLNLDSDLQIAWGADPTVLQVFSPAFAFNQMGMVALQLLPAPKPPVLASANSGATYSDTLQGDVTARDLSATRTSGVFPYGRDFIYLPRRVADDDRGIARLHRLRLGLPGRPAELEDAFIALHQGIRILRNLTPAGATTLPEAVLVNDETGWIGIGDLPADRAEPGLVVPEDSSCLGGAALDVDGDGLRDVLFTMALGAQGQLLWVRNAGSGGFSAALWRSAMALPGLPAFESPFLLREIELPGGPAAAFHDAGLDEIVVLSREAGGALQAQRLPAYGATVHGLRAGDVVGAAAPDLIASVVTAGGAQEVWVYPDDGALSPALAWDPEPPAVALLGADLALAVDAHDPDSNFTITWIRPPFPDATGSETLLVPGAELCAPDPVSVTVRARDALGLFAELRANIPVAVRPSLALVGSDPPGRLLLAPGGVAGRAEGSAWPACGSAPSFVWSAPGLAGLDGTPGEDGSRAWLDFSVPESAYAEALSATAPGEPALTLTASEGALAGTATLPLDLDARGLVAATAAFDRASLDAGEVGVVRVELASRLSVPLPGVRVRVRLDGLAFAGEPSIVGATGAPGPGPGEVVLDPLPAGPAVVGLIVPVRSAGASGGASVELFSASGVRLSPEADPPGADALVPGCGCGTDGGALGLPVLLVLWASCRRRAGSSPGRGDDERAARASSAYAEQRGPPPPEGRDRVPIT